MRVEPNDLTTVGGHLLARAVAHEVPFSDAWLTARYRPGSGDRCRSVEAEEGEQGGVDAPLLFRCAMAGEVGSVGPGLLGGPYTPSSRRDASANASISLFEIGLRGEKVTPVLVDLSPAVAMPCVDRTLATPIRGARQMSMRPGHPGPLAAARLVTSVA